MLIVWKSFAMQTISEPPVEPLTSHICHINCHNCATHTQRQRVRETGRSFGLTPLSSGRVSMHISSADTCINVSNRSTWDAIVVLHGVTVGHVMRGGVGTLFIQRQRIIYVLALATYRTFQTFPAFLSSSVRLTICCHRHANISLAFRTHWAPFSPLYLPLFASNCCRDLTLIFMLLTDWQKARCTSPTLSQLLLSQTLTKSSVKLLSIFFPAQHGVCVMWVWVWVFLKNRVIQYSLPTRCCFDKFTVCVRQFICVCVCVCWLAHISIDKSIMELWINML